MFSFHGIRNEKAFPLKPTALVINFTLEFNLPLDFLSAFFTIDIEIYSSKTTMCLINKIIVKRLRMLGRSERILMVIVFIVFYARGYGDLRTQFNRELAKHLSHRPFSL